MSTIVGAVFLFTSMKHKFYILTNKSFDHFKVNNYRDLWKKAQEEGYTALQAGFIATFTKAESADNIFHAVLSDALEDRHGDIVLQDWDLRAFKKNSVLLDSHDYSTIASIIGRWPKIGVKDNKLQGEVEFMLDNPLGMLAYKMALGGFLNALSAGFIPKEFDDKGKILKSELLEGSMVSVPANPRTLLEKSMGKSEDEPSTEETEQAQTDLGVETPPAPTPEPAPSEKTVRKPVVAYKAAIKLGSDHQALLNRIAKELQGVKPANKQEQKRKIFKAVRSAF